MLFQIKIIKGGSPNNEILTSSGRPVLFVKLILFLLVGRPYFLLINLYYHPHENKVKQGNNSLICFL